MPFCGSIIRVPNGVIWKANILPGKLYTIIFASLSCEGFGRAADAEELLDCLAIEERKRNEREDTPSLLAIDSQSVKCVQFVGEDTGIDGGKKIMRGGPCRRKRIILVDTLGIPWAVKVTSAGTSDNQAGIQALEHLKGKVPRLQKIIGDHGYKTTFIEHAHEAYGRRVEIAQKPESVQGFIPQKNR